MERSMKEPDLLRGLKQILNREEPAMPLDIEAVRRELESYIKGPHPVGQNVHVTALQGWALLAIAEAIQAYARGLESLAGSVHDMQAEMKSTMGMVERFVEREREKGNG
jgi:hypothetical protein